MSARRVVILECDRPGCTSCFLPQRHGTAGDARALAYRHGWKIVVEPGKPPRKRDICEQCVKGNPS